jgi:hypothetical protein
MFEKGHFWGNSLSLSIGPRPLSLLITSPKITVILILWQEMRTLPLSLIPKLMILALSTQWTILGEKRIPLNVGLISGDSKQREKKGTPLVFLGPLVR